LAILRKTRIPKLVFCLSLISLNCITSHVVQAEEDDDLNSIENELSKSAPKKVAPRIDKYGDDKTSSDANLYNLSPFQEVAVIQKRYLPKTGRFEFHGGLTTITNDSFYLSGGAEARIAYYFREAHGVELLYFNFGTTERQITTDLRDINAVATTSLVRAHSYIGLDYKWTPMYGKLTLFNQRLVPFDLYFSFGAGGTGTTTSSAAPTVHIGTGQLFALSKRTAFRWDFSWNFFADKGISGTYQSFNNLFLSVGVSFFYPEAKYR
jgi:outer membrane beta-barrel protein